MADDTEDGLGTSVDTDRPSPDHHLLQNEPKDPGQGRSYEDLSGGLGHDIFFRPPRYTSMDLTGGAHNVLLGSEPHHEICELHDVSQNGVAWYWPHHDPPQQGEVLQRLRVILDRHDAYDGQARIVSVRQEESRLLVGAMFLDSLMDIGDVLQARQLRTRTTVSDHPLWPLTRRVSTTGNPQFKALVSELRLFFEEASNDLARLESTVPWSALHGETLSATRAALIELMQREFVPGFVRYSEEIDRAIRRSDSAENLVLKDYSLRMLQDFMMRAPFLHRTRWKPLGYPGDYVVMRYIYENSFEGQTLFGKSLHLAVCETRGARAVWERKELVKRRMRDLLKAYPCAGRPLRVASIAAGPAQEIFELLRDTAPEGQHMEIVLFDQDVQALSFAQSRVQPQVEARWKPWCKVTYLHDSIKRLLHDPTLFNGFGPFDLIFCTGLFDYLKVPTAARLTQTFWTNLAEGGSAYIGNMHPSNPCRWFLEHHLEWVLTYRTHDEMLEFGHLGAPQAQLSIVEEPTGVNPFLLVQKVH